MLSRNRVRRLIDLAHTQRIGGLAPSADFHSLRYTYGTALARSNAPIKVVQSLARHSTPTLTLAIYAHITPRDAAGALEALPEVSPELEELRTVDTDAIPK